MTEPLVISVDAMGGDHGPSVVAPGIVRAAASLPAHVRFLLHGDEAALVEALGRHPELKARIEIRHASSVIAMDEKPAQALRRGKGSSMWNAVEAIRAGEAAAAISAGNTGGLMAISKLILRMSSALERPALVASWPGAHGITTVLDVGANVDCDAARLVEFAIMGEAFHRAAHGVARPTVALLNVGSEEMKGHEEVRIAHKMLREGAVELDYRGFVEGDDLTMGAIDVVVTDGFTGNVALKAAEGVFRFMIGELRGTLNSTAMARAGALLARPALRAFRERLAPRVAAPLLGLNGLVIKTHGGATEREIADAVHMAVDLAQSDFAAQIERNMSKLDEAVQTPPAADGAA